MNLTLFQLSLLMLFGALGTLARYALTHLFNSFFTIPYLLGTSIVNVIGASLFALLFALSYRFEIPDIYRLISLTGFLGAFTTFSALIFEAYSLMQESFLMGIFYIFIQVCVALILFAIIVHAIK